MSPRPLISASRASRRMHACPSCMSAWSVRSASASGSGYNYDVASPSAFGLGRRYAHAAAMPEEEAGPSRPHRDADYKFPERGARGGPPDPFEILGLERSALPGEIKAKCESLFALAGSGARYARLAHHARNS